MSDRFPCNEVPGFTRSEFLRRAAAGSALLASGGLLAACDDASESTTATGPAGTAGTPVKGGTLRLGAISGGPVESFDTHLGLAAPVTVQMQSMVYDPLVNLDGSGKLLPGLASRVEPNADATEYLLELRPDVRWHDGSPLTPEDVIYSLRYSQEPASFAAPLVAMIDGEGLKKDGAGKVRVPLTRAYARLAPIFSAPGLAIIKDGTTSFARPIGTGAFKVESFTAGERSEYTGNSEYWDEAPYVDGAEIISFGEPNAMLNSLLSEQLDLLVNIPYAIAKAQESNEAVSIHVDQRTAANVFVMRVDRAPFDDVRVRQALKLLVDREALREIVFGGYGEIGNDVMGQGYPLFDTSLEPPARDVEQAKSLLSQAGQSDLNVSLVTSEALTGMAESAVLFAEQAAEGGVTVKVEKVPANTYFSPGAGYLTRVFSQDVWPTVSLEGLWDQSLRTDAPLNETHWSYPGWDQMLDRAEAEQDVEKAAQMWTEPQRIQYEEGGFIIPVNAPGVGASSPNVQNVSTPGMDWSFTPALNHAWLSP